MVSHGPLTRYAKFRVAHAPGMPGTFSPPPRVSDPDMHHGTCVTHVPWCMLGSLTSGFLWSRWRGKRSRHSRRMRNPQFYLSGKRPMPETPTNVPISAIKLWRKCCTWPSKCRPPTVRALRWRHNDHAGVSNHQPHGCLLNRLFRRKSKKTSKLRVTGLCAGNSPGTGEFTAQMASYAENVSI